MLQPQLTEYELERERRIELNKEMLSELVSRPCLWLRLFLAFWLFSMALTQRELVWVACVCCFGCGRRP